MRIDVGVTKLKFDRFIILLPKFLPKRIIFLVTNHVVYHNLIIDHLRKFVSVYYMTYSMLQVEILLKVLYK